MILQHTGIGIDRILLSGISIGNDQLLSACNLFGFIRDVPAVGCSAVPEFMKNAGCSVWRGFSDRKLGQYVLSGTYIYNEGLHIFSVSCKRQGQQVARFQLCRTPANTCTVGYEVHPPHLRQGELQVFDQYITSVIGEHFSYRSFATLGKVSCIEIYTDLLNVPPDSFLIHHPGSRKSANVGTQYSGSRKSPFQAKAYDKRTQLIDTNRPDPYSHHPYRTRLEITRRQTGLYLSQLADLENQFEKIRLYDLDGAAMIKDKRFTWLMKSAQEKGLAVALSRYSKHQREDFRILLDACQVDWYQSLLKLWSSYPKCLEVLQPQYMLEMPTPQTTIQAPKEPLVSLEEIEASLNFFKAIAAMQELGVAA